MWSQFHNNKNIRIDLRESRKIILEPLNILRSIRRERPKRKKKGISQGRLQGSEVTGLEVKTCYEKVARASGLIRDVIECPRVDVVATSKSTRVSGD